MWPRSKPYISCNGAYATEELTSTSRHRTHAIHARTRWRKRENRFRRTIPWFLNSKRSLNFNDITNARNKTPFFSSRLHNSSLLKLDLFRQHEVFRRTVEQTDNCRRFRIPRRRQTLWFVGQRGREMCFKTSFELPTKQRVRRVG